MIDAIETLLQKKAHHLTNWAHLELIYLKIQHHGQYPLHLQMEQSEYLLQASKPKIYIGW